MTDETPTEPPGRYYPMERVRKQDAGEDSTPDLSVPVTED